MAPFFSVIIPVYNVEEYLHQCIDSIIKQDFKDIEIILVDDGSPDLCPEICDEYAEKYDYIRAIHQENGGLSDARNTGILEAKGEYLIFVDSDDWLNKNALLQAFNSINESRKPDILINRIMIYEGDNKHEKECQYYFDTNLLRGKNVTESYQILLSLPEFWASAWMFIVNRKYLLSKNLFFVKGLLHEDEQWSPRLILNSSKIGYNNHCFYYARANRIGSITQTLNIKRDLDKIWIIENLLEESKNSQYNNTAKQLLISRSSSIFMGILMHIDKYKENIEEYKSIVNKLEEKKDILKLSKVFKHKLVYHAINILGVSMTSELLNKLNSSK